MALIPCSLAALRGGLRLLSAGRLILVLPALGLPFGFFASNAAVVVPAAPDPLSVDLNLDSLAPEDAALVRDLQAILPWGWSLTKVTPHTVPDGWWSETASGIRVEGRRGADVFATWFLPRDWIGIRTPNPSRGRPNYWEGILAGEQRTSITVSTESTIPDRLRNLGLSTASIVNGGWFSDERAWKGNFDAADTTAARLIRTHCSDRAARDEAAHSLVVLGIPAAGVFRRAALESGGDGCEFAISALMYFPGKATLDVISTVLRDHVRPERERRAAAWAAWGLADPVLGAPLLGAFRMTRDCYSRSAIARAIARIRYPAGPDLLEALENPRDTCNKEEYAEALSILCYRPAEPALWALMGIHLPPGDSKDMADGREPIEDRVQLALLRLTGDWGAPTEGMRFLLTTPKQAEAGGPIWIVLYVENVSREEVPPPAFPLDGVFVIDGVPHARRPGTYDGPGMPLSAIWGEQEDLGEWLKAPGEYRVHYERGHGKSNTVTVLVK